MTQQKTPNQNCNKKKRIQKIEDSLRGLWDNIKHTNIHIIRILGEERKQEIENLPEEIMTENFPNLAKETDTQIQEAQSPKQGELKEARTKTYQN